MKQVIIIIFTYAEQLLFFKKKKKKTLKFIKRDVFFGKEYHLIYHYHTLIETTMILRIEHIRHILVIMTSRQII